MPEGPPPSYEDTLRSLAERHPELVVMTAENRAAIRNLPAALGPRFVDVGICEQTLVGAAAGLALRGRIPVCHALAAFLTLRAYEFVRTDVGIAGLPVKLVGGVPGFLSEANGPTHQAIEDVALLRSIPGMKIFCPADRAELVAGLPAVVADPAPWYVRFCALEPVVTHEPFVAGVAERLTSGGDATILTYGMLVREALVAQRLLEGRGIRVEVVNLRTLVPLDEACVLAAARTSPLLVTLEDHLSTGGLHSIVAELALRHRVAPRTLPIGLATWFAPALLRDVLEVERMSGAALAERIASALEEEA